VGQFSKPPPNGESKAPRPTQTKGIVKKKTKTQTKNRASLSSRLLNSDGGGVTRRSGGRAKNKKSPTRQVSLMRTMLPVRKKNQRGRHVLPEKKTKKMDPLGCSWGNVLVEGTERMAGGRETAGGLQAPEKKE